MPNYCPVTWTPGSLVRLGSSFLKTHAMLGSCRILVGELTKEVPLRPMIRSHLKSQVHGIILYRVDRLYIFGTMPRGKSDWRILSSARTSRFPGRRVPSEFGTANFLKDDTGFADKEGACVLWRIQEIDRVSIFSTRCLSSRNSF